MSNMQIIKDELYLDCPLCGERIAVDLGVLLGGWKCPECSDTFVAWAADYKCFDMSDPSTQKITVQVGKLTDEMRHDELFNRAIRDAREVGSRRIC